ncbi:S8 family peptidase, partial [Kineococcus indalonis]|uniref:S8 family peptidase n=1 Tax=Kineococcus indalonis TaxID=2696566 RepID=UPI001412A4CD
PTLDADPLWALRALRVPGAWAFSEERGRPARGSGVVVAQPDTGTTDHPELAGVQLVEGFDVLDDDADATDPLGWGSPGHGTATGSVLVSPSSRVITGSAPRARHLPVRAVESVVRITQVSVARAIDGAVARGAHVVTMSLGGIPAFSLHRALRRAVAADVLVLAAAGNCVRFVVWPARYDDCIAVGGSTVHDGTWRGSSRGAAVDVCAPAENVLRAVVPAGGAEVQQGQGTSFAVALTAGVAALWLAHHGRANLVAAAHERGETLQEMFRRLLRATARRPEGWDPFAYGAGIVDAEALLRAPLDLGGGREAAAPPSDPAVRAARSVQSLVAEVAGPEAVQADVDWHRFGPEIATALLVDRLAGLREEGPPREAGAAAPPVSADLAAAVREPRLRAALGLPGTGGTWEPAP